MSLIFERFIRLFDFVLTANRDKVNLFPAIVRALSCALVAGATDG
jgi:hypothetical protein